MSTINTEKNGFVCEIGEKSFKLYTLAAGIVDCPIEAEPPELGEYYEFFAEGKYEKTEIDFPHLKFWAEDDVVYAQAIATGPNAFALPKEMKKKFRYVVWSPFLKYIADSDDNIFNKAVKGGECGEVVVKYAPSDKSLWKVIRMVKWKDVPQQAKSSIMLMTPWTIEYLALNMQPLYVTNPQDLYSCNKKSLVHGHQRSTGVCVVINYKNPVFNRKTQGSYEKVSLMWSPIFGLSRWGTQSTDKTEHEHSRDPQSETKVSVAAQLGRWYSYCLNDHRVKNRKAGRNVEGIDSFNSCTVTGAVEITPVKPTRVVYAEKGPQVEMECAFAFKHDDLEHEENREKEWSERFCLLLKSAHFHDTELGKVEIYPSESRIIIEAIEKYRKEQSPEDAELYKDDVIMVCVRVSLLYNFFKNYDTYPENGLFVVRHVDTVKYLHSGKILKKKAD